MKTFLQYISDQIILEGFDLTNEISQLKFKPNWEINKTPSFDKAKIKFIVNRGASNVIIKLYISQDCENNQDGEKYWEVIGSFPLHWDQAPIRKCPFNDIESLLEFVEEGLS